MSNELIWPGTVIDTSSVMSEIVQVTAPITHTPGREEVEALTMGVFTLDEQGRMTTDPAVREWMEAMTR